MPLTDVKKILVRATVDSGFRKKLLEQPDEVLSRYELTEEEAQCLRALDSEEQFEACCEESLKPSDFVTSDIRI